MHMQKMMGSEPPVGKLLIFHIGQYNQLAFALLGEDEIFEIGTCFANGQIGGQKLYKFKDELDNPELNIFWCEYEWPDGLGVANGQ